MGEYGKDDEDVVVEVPRREALPSEATNLVPFLADSEDGKEFLEKLADKVTSDFKKDWESSEGYRKRRKDRYKLLTGNLDPKTWPFEDCANVHIPVMLERVLRIVHRIYAELFPERDFVFQAVPSSKLGQERADIVTLHENWQLRKEVPDFFRQNRRGLLEFIANGDVFWHSYRDIDGRRNRHEVLNCEEFVIPYVWKTTMVDLSDVPRKTRILRKTRHELEDLAARGIYSGVADLLEKLKTGSFERGPELVVRPEVDRSTGTEAPDSDRQAPYALYEQHSWCKLPGQPRERPVTITVEEQTRTVLYVSLREEEDWKDRVRYEREMAEHGRYQADVAFHQSLVQREQQVRARLAMPDVPPDEGAVLAAALDAGSPPPPTMPKWMRGQDDVPEAVRLVPIEAFSHGVCIENIDGSLGLGIGLLLEEFNKAADTAASQFTDAATLANVTTMIMPEGIKMDPGDTRLTPGLIHRVRGVSAETIQNAFKVLQFSPANPQLLEVIRLALDAADGVSSAPDVLSGEAGKANETYRGLATRVEQATRQLTVLATNYIEVLSQVCRNNARLNAVFLGDEEMLSVIDPRTLDSRQIKIGRDLYREDFEILFSADTRFASKQQRISEADQLVGMIGALPPPVAAMMFPPSFIYEAVVRSLKARGMHDMVSFLPPRPPPPGAGPPPGLQPPGPPGPQPPGSPGPPPPRPQA